MNHLQFENLFTLPEAEIENENMPTESLLKKWAPNVDYEAEASKQGLTYQIYVSREVNKLAHAKGIDGIQYGSLFVQIINNPI